MLLAEKNTRLTQLEGEITLSVKLGHSREAWFQTSIDVKINVPLHLNSYLRLK